VEKNIVNISLKLVDPIKTVEKNINLAISNSINDKINSNIGTIKSRAKILVRDWVFIQPEIQSLLSNGPDSLVGYFGITRNSGEIVEAIINSVAGATEVKLIKYDSSLSGGLEIRFQPFSFVNLLALSEGRTIYSDGNLHWLEWLLKRGDRIIVANYQYNPITGFGRSGLGIMMPGGAFRVPPQFSGTEDNNFITRALIGKTQENQIAQLIQRVLA
jgi:hypothetical protein